MNMLRNELTNSYWLAINKGLEMNLNKKPIYKYVKTLFFGAFISVIIIDDAAATCTSNTATPGVVNFTINENIIIPRDTPIGEIIYTSPAATSVGHPLFSCTGDYTGLVSTGSVQSNFEYIFPIGETGLGFKFYWHNSTTNLVNIYGEGKTNTNGQQVGFGSSPFYLKIIKIRPTLDTIEIPAGSIANYLAGELTILRFQLANKINITQQTCTVSNINVPMGVQPASGFQGINTRMAPRDFAISLNNCPSGINSVKYRIDPTTTIINPTKSVVTLQSNSTASGVGVQILDASSNPLPLGVDNVFSGYAATGGNYSIPLKAAYYQTGYIAKGGSANTSLTFTMTYQ